MSDKSAAGHDSSPLSAEDEYISQLSYHLVRRLACGVSSFTELVRQGEGAYPADIKTALHAVLINDLPGVRQDIVAKMLRQLASVEVEAPPSGGSEESGFRDPHPADYDWRFSSETRAMLVRRLATMVQSGERVAIFGAPTLVPAMTGLEVRTILIDRSQSAVADLKRLRVRADLLRHDLFHPLPAGLGRVDAVVADPPWYPADHRAFIVRAVESLRRQGWLLLSVLPWLTRPQAVDDRRDIIVFAQTAGFDLAEIVPGALNYESPKFERHALATEGLYCGNWRKGDLFVLRRIRDPRSELVVEPPADEPEWDEFVLGERKVKIRRRVEVGRSQLNARPVHPSSPILGSVSRRSPLRSSIDLWTSDNVAYAIDRLDVVREAVARLTFVLHPKTVALQAASEHALSEEERRKLEALLEEVVRGVNESY